MQSLASCLTQASDQGFLLIAAVVCIAGTYATFSLAAQAVRTLDRERKRWGVTSVVAAGATAWATHMLAMMAFRPGMAAGFEPVLTVLSLLAGVVGISLGTFLAVRWRRPLQRFLAGFVVAAGVGALGPSA